MSLVIETKNSNFKFQILFLKLTVVISKGEEFFIGSIKEIPAVLSQGETIEEARENVLDALNLYLKDMQNEDDYLNKVLEEDLIIS